MGTLSEGSTSAGKSSHASNPTSESVLCAARNIQLNWRPRLLSFPKRATLCSSMSDVSEINPKREFLRVAEAARELRVARSTLYRWYYGGSIQGVRLGRGNGFVISRSDVERIKTERTKKESC